MSDFMENVKKKYSIVQFNMQRQLAVTLVQPMVCVWGGADEGIVCGNLFENHYFLQLCLRTLAG